MYVDYPSNHAACCRACGPAEGCSPLIPTWISASPNKTFVGAYTGARGQTCYEWCIPGAYAAADCWAFSVDPSSGAQVPCQYHETFTYPGTDIVHNLTFTAFQRGRQPDTPFTVRPECHKPCPRLFPTTCG
jgi:hypothetical protein